MYLYVWATVQTCVLVLAIFMRKLQGPPGKNSQNDTKQSLLVQLAKRPLEFQKFPFHHHAFFESWPNPSDFFGYLGTYRTNQPNPTPTCWPKSEDLEQPLPLRDVASTPRCFGFR